ncbi:hypothetical protein SLH49_13945 [Cognatiyoonia sp. IB215446]|uniref:hypothetical protein n=1 Tax=Cognatiyoonia sp. IB215446 TaxID=3097355 RepID=UPI002A17B20C|nr:hypothetical protein [Cognatiyoonia sp. IB215446]MDX8349084.1 hypothetical protein [Cognatiyoonia sp. IB215446]
MTRDRFRGRFLKTILGVACLLIAGTSWAQERGSASVKSCQSVTTCFEDGSCNDRPYKLQYVLAHYFDLTRPGYNRIEFLANGPTVAEAGGGKFFLNTVTTTAPVNEIGEILERGYGQSLARGWVAAINTNEMFFGQGRLFYVRPAKEVERSRRGAAVTEFRCGQMLF